MTLRFCSSCGAARIEGARFCGSCGADLEALGGPTVPAVAGAVPQAPPVAQASSASPPRESRPVPTIAAAMPSPPSRRPRQRIVALLILIVAGGIGGFLMLGRSSVTYAGVFTPTGDLAAMRSGHTATLLPNGRVLIAGGYQEVSTSSVLASAELFR